MRAVVEYTYASFKLGLAIIRRRPLLAGSCLLLQCGANIIGSAIQAAGGAGCESSGQSSSGSKLGNHVTASGCIQLESSVCREGGQVELLAG